MLCSIEGCEKPTKTRGWCDKHYQRWIKHRDPLAYFGNKGKQSPCSCGAPRARSGGKCNACRREYARATLTPEQTRRTRLRWVYGLTPEQYDEMFAAQQGRCAICAASDPGPRGWHVDHDHTSGRVRGILCRNCNVALGHMGDNPERLRAAAKYLEVLPSKS